MDKPKHRKHRQQSSDPTYIRKIKKPLVEKKRRERINTSLLQLKQLLLENIKMNGGTQVSKLDKADILELTVGYLRHIHQQQKSVAMATHCSTQHCSTQPEYISSYRKAATESLAFIQNRESVSSTSESAFMNSIVYNNLNQLCPEDLSIRSVTSRKRSACIPTLAQTDTTMPSTQTDNSFEGFKFRTYQTCDSQDIINANTISYSYDLNNLEAGNIVAEDNNNFTIEVSKTRNAVPQIAVFSDVLDFNGNVDREVINFNQHCNHRREHSINDSVETEHNDGDSDDEDKLYIHLDDGDDVSDDGGPRNENIRDIENNNVQREDVWRPW